MKEKEKEEEKKKESQEESEIIPVEEEKSETLSDVVKARVEGYARGRGISPEVIDNAVADLTRIAASVAEGDLDLDMLELVITGREHNKLLAEAVHEAELRGRNAAIEAKMREAIADDGLPHLGSTGSSRKTSRRSIFTLAQSAR